MVERGGEMVERVADAISEGCNYALPPMREPTEAMVKAVYTAMPPKWHMRIRMSTFWHWLGKP